MKTQLTDQACPRVRNAYQCIVQAMDNGDDYAEVSLDPQEMRDVRGLLMMNFNNMDVQAHNSEGYIVSGDVLQVDLNILREQKRTRDDVRRKIDKQFYGWNDMAKATAISRFLCEKYTYDKDSSSVKDASGKANCIVYSESFAELARASGIEAGTIVGEYEGCFHEWNYAVLDGTKYYIDVTASDASGRFQISRTEFADHIEKLMF